MLKLTSADALIGWMHEPTPSRIVVPRATDRALLRNALAEAATLRP